MNTKESQAADLAGLRERLTSGIHPAMERSRQDAFLRDRLALSREWPTSYREALKQIRNDIPAEDSVPEEDRARLARAINAMSRELRRNRALLIAVLFAPAEVLTHIEAFAYSPGTKIVDSWIGMFWLTQAAWDAIGCGLPADAGYAAGESELLRPLAARLWFLVGSEPMRSRAQDGAWWRRGEADMVFGESGLLGRALGEGSWHQVASQCQQARLAWLDCLNLAGLWAAPSYGHAGMVLLLATSWCLAVGVFSQILWDDRPITAPLAHVSWRSGRSVRRGMLL